MDSAIESVVNCGCFSKRAKYPDPYEFAFEGGRASGAGQTAVAFESNEIRTSKYTVLTFLPSTSGGTQRR